MTVSSIAGAPAAPPCVVAHRGYCGIAPENTLPALAAGVAAGAGWIEFDVRTSADGVPVVIHDRSVDRTTDGVGPVSELTLDELRRLDAGSWFSPAYAGLRAPTLAEALDLLEPTEAELLVEIKRPATADEVKAIVVQLAERGVLARAVVQSFSPDVLRHARAAAPDVRLGLLRTWLDPDPVAVAREVDAVFYNPAVADLLAAADVAAEPAPVQALQAAGVAVLPWTANTPAQWQALAALGVAGVITDHPGALLGHLTRPDEG